MNADDFAEIARRAQEKLRAQGINVEIEVIRLPIPNPAAEDPERCPFPHSPCPVCNGALCFGPGNKAPELSVCGNCASFLRSDPSRLPRPVRLLTEEEIVALPDDERISLQRARRYVEQRSGRRGRPETPRS